MPHTTSIPASDFASPAALTEALDRNSYLADEGLATACFLSLRMRRPLFLEGDAGVGKTELAKTLAAVLDVPLIRLQCYEGLDAAQALYDWDFPRQLLHLRAAEAAGVTDVRRLESELYDRRFLVSRPLLQALETSSEDRPSVLLVDEIDRADDEFEAFLLEVLSDFTISIPELGTIHAERPPVVVVTSNRTREVHDALKRRCLYHWLEHPAFEREVAIIRRRLPEAADRLVRQVAGASARLRELDLLKAPGVAESLDWAEALVALGARDLDPDTAAVTLGAVLKYREDTERVVERGLGALLERGLTMGGPRTRDVVETMTGFARTLRAAGVGADPERLQAMVGALRHLDVLNPADVYWAGRLTLCADPADLPRYDRCFAAYFSGGSASMRRTAPPPVTVVRHTATAATAGEEKPGDVTHATASEIEVLRRRDVARLSPAERAEVHRLLTLLDDVSARRRSRRFTARHRGRLDPHRTIRSILRRGGELSGLRYRAHRTRPRRVVLLVDVSGSMSPYADVFLRFAHAVARSAPRSTEVFSTGTRLTRVTRELRNREPDAAMAAVSAAIPDWSGGTRLGEELKEFLDRFGQRGMARGAIVVIASDGWERGDAGLLGEQMARLRRLAHRVVWSNPHKAQPGYEPLTAGMTAALPYVDDFVAGHSLAALEELAGVIGDA